MDDIEVVKGYHKSSRHHINRYADGPGHLDWDTQPNPVRSFTGADIVELPLAADSVKTPYAALFGPEAVAPAPVEIKWLGALFELSAGISAWRRFGETKWALRCNPSSGNLHPVEFYAVTGGMAGLPAGVYHYDPYRRQLARRCVPADGFAGLAPEKSFIIGLSSILWREEWKYGERAYRYCNLDAGHAIAAVRLAAQALGWRAILLPEPADMDVAALLGLNRRDDFGYAEAEEPVGLMLVSAEDAPAKLDAKTVESLASFASRGAWSGAANILSCEHEYTWPEADKATRACVKPVTVETPWTAPATGAVQQTACDEPAADVIRKRRSAQAYDARAVIPEENFYRMLDATLPRYGAGPWDAAGWSPRIHLVIFVHNVEGLSPGLYTLLRREGVFPKLRSAMLPQFDWIRPDNAPPNLPIFRLTISDERRMARMLSCHQDIASGGVFSLGMLAEFDANLALGAWWYRRMFWEAGMAGQVLYLEAEAAGLRGTGIGCFFDDSFHELLGLRGTAFQSLYHFTVGAPVHDTRLDTLPPYYHLNGR